ncbi:C2H2-type zinc finger protein [Streptomyces fuscigenes]|uniref:C2H2-type zinc finger protein n=1 Tax=Streptomyces fuscigenes TaxID=1528880 RepID=UPI001F42DD36|nr:C2H2-type zinc finger protein [Streptomyces fuscigenes]MCF3962883.1 C2H2-type zinc finger protein [Streptomyces fuscigenes]
MSFGQGGPQWGGGSGPQNQNPYGPAYGQDPQQPQQAQPLPQQQPWHPVVPDGRDQGGQAPGGLPGAGGAGSDGTPDWAALADASAVRNRRKRWFMIGGIALATCAVGAIVATAVVSAGSSDHGADPGPSGSQALPPLPDPSASPEPSFSSVAPKPPPNPKDFIDSAAKDKAPLSAATLFPGKRLTIGGRTYVKGATSATTSCAAATQGALGPALGAHGCTEVFRATYARDGVAVTVGVAVFDREAQALAVKKQSPAGGVASLAGAGVPTFCRVTVCRTTTNSYGRYAYFTVGGFETRRAVTDKDKQVFTAGDDISNFAFRQIVGRGQSQASAAADAQDQ